MHERSSTMTVLQAKMLMKYFLLLCSSNRTFKSTVAQHPWSEQFYIPEAID